VQQIADWLGQLGLRQYAQRFAENEIDVSVLRHLTDQDLKDIGIPLGHRRKMLAAVSELIGVAPATLAPTARIEPKLQDAAERRQVTVFNRSIRILWHSVNQYLASRITYGTFKQTGLRYSSSQFLS
jgi:hypothetical protein